MTTVFRFQAAPLFHPPERREQDTAYTSPSLRGCNLNLRGLVLSVPNKSGTMIWCGTVVQF